MRDDRRDSDPGRLTLALLALRYAAGELPPDRAAAFEARLATDPAAQDALAEAVRLSARALGQTPPAPDPLTRSAIVGRLRPAASVIGRWLRAAVRRRPYRGHPVAWAGVGAGLAAGVLATGAWLADRDPGFPSAPPPTVQAPRPADPEPAAPLPDMNRAAAAPADPAPPMGGVPKRAEAGGGGEAALPHDPATTFLPVEPDPAERLKGMAGEAAVGTMGP